MSKFILTEEQLRKIYEKCSEDVIDEMAYPACFNMDEFKQLTSFNARIQYCQNRLKRLGSGSSRIVYQIDNEKCLKLAKNKKGIAQNEAENDGYVQSVGIAAEVYDCHPDYLWIEMQLARPAKKSDFKRLTGYDFNTMCAWVEYVKSRYVYGRFYRNHDYDELFDSDAFYENFDYSLFDMLQDYMSNTGLTATGDLQRISSWGVVSKNGEEELVLIDFGLNDDVFNDFYKRKI